MFCLNKRFENNIWYTVVSSNIWLNLNNSLRNRSGNQVGIDIKSSLAYDLNNSLRDLEYGITYDGLKVLIQKDDKEQDD